MDWALFDAPRSDPRCAIDARDAAQRVKAADFAEEGMKGPALGAAIQAAQIEQIAAVLAGAKAAL